MKDTFYHRNAFLLTFSSYGTKENYEPLTRYTGGDIRSIVRQCRGIHYRFQTLDYGIAGFRRYLILGV